jgi:hypothetical protein
VKKVRALDYLANGHLLLPDPSKLSGISSQSTRIPIPSTDLFVQFVSLFIQIKHPPKSALETSTAPLL